MSPSADEHDLANDTLVCVLCGRPWLPEVKNLCECGGFCSWGEKQGGDPSSWTVTEQGWIPNPPPASARATAAWADACDGSSGCTAQTHIHGCFADQGNCDEPGEHASEPLEREVANHGGR